MVEQIKLGHEELPHELRVYLLPTERPVFVVRRHWVVLIEPVLTTVIGLVILGYVINLVLPTNVSPTVFVLIWLGWALRSAWRIWAYYTEYFVATDRRLILNYGIVTRRVAMMPLAKVTDMSYNRTVPGKLLGYGKFVLESAGQDQALSTVNFVPNPDFYYRKINEQLFSPPARRASDRPPPAGSALPVTEPNEQWWKRR